MRSAMPYVFVFAGLLAIAVSQTVLRPIAADCFLPQNPDWVYWEHSKVYPDTTQADQQGNFSTNQRFHWCYTNTPFIGAAQFMEAESENIESVQYSPAYWFPSSNAGSVIVNWSGQLEDPGQNGLVKTKGWCWPPYAEAFRSVTVLKY